MRLSAQDFPISETWKQTPMERSAEHAVRLTSYVAPNVILIPVVCARRDDKLLSADKPIRVVLHESADGTIAENDNLQVYAYGANAAAALGDFRSQLIELYHHYVSLQDDDVTGDAVHLRKLFLGNFTLTQS
jgi:hypothetical protein